MPLVNIHQCKAKLVDKSFLGVEPDQMSRIFELEVPELVLNSCDKIAVIGSSGSGKSTLLEMLSLLLQPTVASTFLMNFTAESQEDMNVMSIWQEGRMFDLTQARSRFIGSVSASGGLFPSVSLKTNALYRGKLAGKTHEETMSQIELLSEELEISNCMEFRGNQLSRGQAFRGAILLALVHKPRLILADEPTASLNPSLAGKLLTLLSSIADRDHSAVVIATHDIEAAKSAGYRLLKAQVLGDSRFQQTRFLW